MVLGSPGVGSAGVIELSSLNGTNGFVLNGIDANDQSAYSVSSAGDVNGDGVDDLLIGALRADPNGATDAGESYVVFGGAGVGSTGVIELSALNGTNGFVLNGIFMGGQSGYSVSSAGDVNGDGVDDLIIGARDSNPNGSDSGESYVVFGGAGVGSTGTIELSSLNGTNGFVINGIEARVTSAAFLSPPPATSTATVSTIFSSGRSVPTRTVPALPARATSSSAARASGARARSSSPPSTASTASSSTGSTRGDHSGESVSSAGDVNGDGFDDLIIGARCADPNGNTDAGESYVVFGAQKPTSPADLNGNGCVGSEDLAILLAAWGPNPGNTADLSGDNTVNSGDLAILLAAWGTGCN